MANFNVSAYLANKKAAAAKAKAKVEQAQTTMAKAIEYASQEGVAESVQEHLFGEMHQALAVESAAAKTKEKNAAKTAAELCNQQAVDKLDADLKVIYGNVVDLQDESAALRKQAAAIKEDVAEKLEVIQLTSVADRIAAARAAKAAKTVKKTV